MADKPYLQPSEYVCPRARVIYEPPLEVGTVVRLGDEQVEIVGFDQRETTAGPVPCAYGLWDRDDEPHLTDYRAFLEWCEQQGIADPDAYLQTPEGAQRWLRPAFRKGDRRCFDLGCGAFDAALIGGHWIPVTRETIRTQQQPVLGWAVSESKASHKGSDQTKGHRQTRGDQGKWVAEAVNPDGSAIVRKRWTTTLRVEALECLAQMSESSGLHRNEVVEQLLIGSGGGSDSGTASVTVSAKVSNQLAGRIKAAAAAAGQKPSTWLRELIARTVP